MFTPKIEVFKTNSQLGEKYVLKSTGERKFMELDSIYKLNQNMNLLLNLNQDKQLYEGRILFENTGFGQFKLNSHYYSISIGSRIHFIRTKTSLLLNFAKHYYDIEVEGYAESWPFTSAILEFFGAGVVANFNGLSKASVNELQVEVKHFLKANIELCSTGRYFYLVYDEAFLELWKRKSGILGLLEPGQYDLYIIPSEFKYLHFGKISIGLNWYFKKVEIQYRFSQFLPLNIGVGVHSLSIATRL